MLSVQTRASSRGTCCSSMTHRRSPGPGLTAPSTVDSFPPSSKAPPSFPSEQASLLKSAILPACLAHFLHTGLCLAPGLHPCPLHWDICLRAHPGSRPTWGAAAASARMSVGKRVSDRPRTGHSTAGACGNLRRYRSRPLSRGPAWSGCSGSNLTHSEWCSSCYTERAGPSRYPEGSRSRCCKMQ